MSLESLLDRLPIATMYSIRCHNGTSQLDNFDPQRELVVRTSSGCVQVADIFCAALIDHWKRGKIWSAIGAVEYGGQTIEKEKNGVVLRLRSGDWSVDFEETLERQVLEVKGLTVRGKSRVIGRFFKEWNSWCRAAWTLLLCLRKAYPVLYRIMRREIVEPVFSIEHYDAQSVTNPQARKLREMMLETWFNNDTARPECLQKICEAFAAFPLDDAHVTKTELFRKVVERYMQEKQNADRAAMRADCWMERNFFAGDAGGYVEDFLAAEHLHAAFPADEVAKELKSTQRDRFLQFVVGMATPEVIATLPQWCPPQPWAQFGSHDRVGHGPLACIAEDKTGLYAKCLEAHWNADVLREHGRALLQTAASEGFLDAARWLLEHNVPASFAETGVWGQPLHYACANSENKELYLKIVRLLLEHGADPNAYNVNGVTAAHIAAGHGNVDMLAALHAHGADLLAQDKQYGMTPMMNAASYDKHIVLEWLIRNGHASANDMTEKGLNSLMCAAQCGHIESVKLLLRCGADVNATELEHSRSVLFFAADSKCLPLVRLLIRYGARLDARDKEGWLPMDIAVDAKASEVVEEFIAQSAPFSRMQRSWSYLHCAAHAGALRFVEEYCSREDVSDIHVADDSLEMPLHRASEEGHVKIVQLLISRGANVNALNMFGTSPILLAAFGGRPEVVRVLIENGAELQEEPTKKSIAAFVMQGSSVGKARNTLADALPVSAKALEIFELAASSQP